MNDECYWNYPLKGKDGRTENGSKKYRDYYFEKNGEVTSKEIADYFGISESSIESHKSNYRWDDALNDKKAYERKKRLEKRDEKYQQHLDKDNENANTTLTIKYAQIQIAAIKIGILPPNPQLEIPPELTFDKAWDTINRIGIENLQKIIMRNFEQPATINGTQHHTAEINSTNTNLNFNMKSDMELDEIYENRFKDFISNAFGGNE